MFLKIIKHHQNVDFTKEESLSQSRKENKSTVWGMKYDLRKKKTDILFLTFKKKEDFEFLNNYDFWGFVSNNLMFSIKLKLMKSFMGLWIRFD